jgi:outer membrane protein assembly factor BamB
VIRALAALAAGAALLSGGQRQQAALSGWLTYGNGSARLNFTAARLGPGPLHGWHLRLDGGVLTQPLVVRGVPEAGRTTVYVGTSAGSVYAVSPAGEIRWQAQLGGLRDHECPQLPEYGIVGTPAVDPAGRSLLAADALGRLHALDLATGRERPGWPVTLYDDYRRELVWGALLVAGGSVYVPTGAYCDLRPMQGKLFRVSLATRTVSSWAPVPERLGGGGGIWGWGGLASMGSSLFVAPGNAFSGGVNVGSKFDESAGYGEHLVQLGLGLDVRAAHHPGSVPRKGDFDFGGAPTLVSAPGCGHIAVVTSKNGRLYAWRTASVRNGVLWTFDLRTLKPRKYPLVTQLAYSPPQRAIAVATGLWLVRLTLDRTCRPRLAWKLALPRWAYNGSPTIAGGDVWVGVKKTKRLLGADLRTGRLRVSRRLDGAALAAPSLAGGRLYVATEAGGLYGFAAGGREGR